MVKEIHTYLFVGEDVTAKEIKLKRLREELLSRDTEQFNLDILYAKELGLGFLQERLLCLPVKEKKRLIVIKDADNLKEDIQEFILKYVKEPYPQIVLILDMNTGKRFFATRDAKGNHKASKERFVEQLARYALVCHFKQTIPPNTFNLTRLIQGQQPHYALLLLSQLLRYGEKPEWILGGLRYAWEQDRLSPLERKRALRLLLNCDLEVKTGRLKPAFALEKLVINLCALGTRKS